MNQALLLYAMRLLLRRSWALVLFPLLAGGLGFAVASQSEPEWVTHGLLRLQSVGNEASVPGVERTVTKWAVMGRLLTQLELFEARTVLQEAGRAELHAELVALASDGKVPLPDGTDGANPLEDILGAYDGSGATSEALREVAWTTPEALRVDAEADPLASAFVAWALGKGPYGDGVLRGSLDVARLGETELVKVKFSAGHRSLAPRLLSGILETTRIVLGESERFNSDNRMHFFQQRVDVAKAQLAERERALKSFLGNNDIANYTDQTRALANNIEDTRMRLARVKEDAARYTERRDGIVTTLGGPDFLNKWGQRLESDGQLLALRDELARTRAREWLEKTAYNTEGSTSRFDLSPKVDEYLQGRLAGLEPHRQELVYDWLSESLELSGTEAGLKVLRDHLTDSEQVMRRYATLGSEINRMEREIDVAEREYLQLVQGLNAATLLARAADGGRPFAVVDVASVPVDPEPRGRLLTVVMVAGIAFGLVVVAILVLEQLDQSLNTPSAVEAAFDLPVLGGLPHLQDPEAPDDDPSVLARSLVEGVRARVASAAGDASTVQVVSLVSGAGAGVVSTVLRGDTSRQVVEKPSIATSSEAFRVCDDAVTVWVIRAGSTATEADRRAMRDLEAAGSPVVGIVINQIGYVGAEELLGVVPRPRSGLRTWIRRLATLELRREGPWRPDS